MSHTTHPSDARVTLRAPLNLTADMRSTARFFGRTVSREWIAAAEVYLRVLDLWSVAENDLDNDAGRMLVRLCSGIVAAPAPLAHLRAVVRGRTDNGAVEGDDATQQEGDVLRLN